MCKINSNKILSNSTDSLILSLKLAEIVCVAERLEAYLCTQAHTLFSLYRELDCSADTMARRDEKFLRIRHSCKTKAITVTTWQTWNNFINLCKWVFFFPDLSYIYPALYDPRPDVWPELPVLQHCADHTGCNSVELSNGGSDGGSTVLVVLLVPLGPDGAQAVVGYNLFKQQLEIKWKKTSQGCNLSNLALLFPSHFPPLTASM